MARTGSQCRWVVTVGSSGRSHKPWTEAEVHTLLDAFRTIGVSFTIISKMVGRDRRTVQKVYERGLKPNKHTGFHGIPPIREILARENVAARAKMVELQALPEPPSPATVENMREQVIRARMMTGVLLEDLKSATRTLTPGAKRLAEGCGSLLHRMGDLLYDLNVVDRDPQDGEISLAGAMFAMKDVAQTLQTVTSTVKELTDMERRELGEPTEITGLAITMTDEEAVEKIREAKRVFEFIDVDELDPPPVED